MGLISQTIGEVLALSAVTRADLADPDRWAQCARFEGGTQPCACSRSRRQQEWIAAGGVWPDRDAGAFRDYIAATQHRPCNAALYPSTVQMR